MESEALLRTLQAADKVNADWQETARKLRLGLERHIREEEGRMFEAARQLFTEEEAEAMGDAFERLKPEVQEDGFTQKTLNMIANLLPTRLAASLRTFTHNPR